MFSRRSYFRPNLPRLSGTHKHFPYPVPSSSSLSGTHRGALFWHNLNTERSFESYNEFFGIGVFFETGVKSVSPS